MEQMWNVDPDLRPSVKLAIKILKKNYDKIDDNEIIEINEKLIICSKKLTTFDLKHEEKQQNCKIQPKSDDLKGQFNQIEEEKKKEKLIPQKKIQKPQIPEKKRKSMKKPPSIPEKRNAKKVVPQIPKKRESIKKVPPSIPKKSKEIPIQKPKKVVSPPVIPGKRKSKKSPPTIPKKRISKKIPPPIPKNRKSMKKN